MGNIIQFQKQHLLQNYEYFLGFDLATHITGWSLVRVEWGPNVKYTLVDSGILDSSKYDKDLPTREAFEHFKQTIDDAISNCQMMSNEENPRVLLVKERLPNQSGTYTTIDTLQSLAQTHALFDLAVDYTPIEVYNKEGIAAVSAKAYFKRVWTDACSIPFAKAEESKKQIRALLCGMVDGVTADTDLNITDSIALICTLIDGCKWDDDIANRQREIRRLIKSGKYKSQKKNDELQQQIEELEDIKLHQKKQKGR